MKKNYMTPATMLHPFASEVLLTTISGVVSDKGISYGGVDEEGEIDPSAKQRDMLDPAEKIADDQQVWEQGLW